jgi:ATP-dependent Clp protease ATP-binding subunit ClpA
LKACGAQLSNLRGDLVEFIDSTTPLIPEGDHERETQPTLGFQRVLQRAVFHVQSSGKSEVTGANVLVAIFSEQESQAVYFLKSQNVSRLDVVNFITHGISKVEGKARALGSERESGQPARQLRRSPRATRWTALRPTSTRRRRQGRIDPLIGRSRRGRARHPGAGAAAQEQSAAGR